DAIALRLRALCLYTLLTRHPPSLTLFPYTTLFRSDFQYRQGDDSLLFDISKLNTFNGFTADSIEKYRNALPIELCVDGINGKRGKFVEIKAPEFFRWIGEHNPYEKETTVVNNDEQSTATVEEEKPKKKGFWARLFG